MKQFLDPILTRKFTSLLIVIQTHDIVRIQADFPVSLVEERSIQLFVLNLGRDRIFGVTGCIVVQ